MTRPSDVAIIGAGLGGLGAALFLARRGHRVTVVERDPAPPPTDAAAIARWTRRGTPQAAQSHAFVARSRQLLMAEAPDLLAALLEAGVGELRLDADPPPTLTGPVLGDSELVVLLSRRAVFEWVLRRAAESQDGVSFRAGAAAAGLVADTGPGGLPVVSGVRLDDGSVTRADAVIDAAGARSPVRGWLGEGGVTLPPERVVACGIAYCSRFFQLRPGADPGPLNRGYTGGGSFDRYSCLVFPADNGTFSVTLGLLPEDRALMRLHDDDAFLAAARSVELVADWVDPERAEPIGRVAAMRGLNNRWRPLVEAGRPPVLGVLAVGDSACITNPAHTRGSTLALVSALAAAQAIDAHPGDPEAQVLKLDTELRGEQEQWWFDSVQQDAARLARWRPQMSAPDPPPDGWVSNSEAYLGAQRDPRVWRAFTRAQQLLIPAADVLGDAEMVARVRQVQAEGWSPPGLQAPGHDELVAVAAAASDGLAQDRAVG